jgi:hypothetical protein
VLTAIIALMTEAIINSEASGNVYIISDEGNFQIHRFAVVRTQVPTPIVFVLLTIILQIKSSHRHALTTAVILRVSFAVSAASCFVATVQLPNQKEVSVIQIPAQIPQLDTRGNMKYLVRLIAFYRSRDLS